MSASRALLRGRHLRGAGVRRARLPRRLSRPRSARFGWTSTHLSELPRRVDASSGTDARGTLTLKRRRITRSRPRPPLADGRAVVAPDGRAPEAPLEARVPVVLDGRARVARRRRRAGLAGGRGRVGVRRGLARLGRLDGDGHVRVGPARRGGGGGGGHVLLARRDGLGQTPRRVLRARLRERPRRRRRRGPRGRERRGEAPVGDARRRRVAEARRRRGAELVLRHHGQLVEVRAARHGHGAAPRGRLRRRRVVPAAQARHVRRRRRREAHVVVGQVPAHDLGSPQTEATEPQREEPILSRSKFILQCNSILG